MSEEKPAHHQVKVIRVPEIIKHPNADTLGLITIPDTSYQVVVKLGDFKTGDWAFYIPPDNVVPTEKRYSFLWASAVLPDGTLRDGMREIPVKYLRVRARQFRKAWSEGLLMPFEPTDAWAIGLQEGQDISDILSITHYQPPDPDDLRGENERGPKSPYPRSFKGWMYWVWYKIKGLFGFYDPTRGSNERGPKYDPGFYDIENIKNFRNAFQPTDSVIVTEKLHGSQFRAVYQDGHFYVGSRRLWKHPKSKDIWRKAAEQNPWIEEFCRQNEGCVLYGEVVPTQGDSFRYGCKPGELKVFVFDIKDGRGFWNKERTFSPMREIVLTVPILYVGLYNELIIKPLVEGKSAVDGTTIREGLVISLAKEERRHIYGLGRLQLKQVSNEFLIKS